MKYSEQLDQVLAALAVIGNLEPTHQSTGNFEEWMVYDAACQQFQENHLPNLQALEEAARNLRPLAAIEKGLEIAEQYCISQ